MTDIKAKSSDTSGTPRSPGASEDAGRRSEAGHRTAEVARTTARLVETTLPESLTDRSGAAQEAEATSDRVRSLIKEQGKALSDTPAEASRQVSAGLQYAATVAREGMEEVRQDLPVLAKFFQDAQAQAADTFQHALTSYSRGLSESLDRTAERMEAMQHLMLESLNQGLRTAEAMQSMTRTTLQASWDYSRTLASGMQALSEQTSASSQQVMEMQANWARTATAWVPRSFGFVPPAAFPAKPGSRAGL